MNIRRWLIRLVLATTAPWFLSSFALSQAATPPNPETTQVCPGLIAGDRAKVIPAAWHAAAPNLGGLNSGAFSLAALNSDQVRLSFLGHATFLIESPQLVRIATDYNDYIRPPLLPDIVTMNHAHNTHYSDHPDPAIKYVLRGWGEDTEHPAIWDLKYRDVRVRNVPTNIRSFYGSTTTERYGNSIFIFEIANLCIAHLGHLHHTLHAAAVGRNRPHRRGHGAGRRQLYARSRRHDGSAYRAQGAADHSDALLRPVHPRPVSRPGAQAVGCRNRGHSLGRGLESDAASLVQGSGAARAILIA
jgi:beta-lactamase family protein